MRLGIATVVWLLCAAAPPAVSAERILAQRTAPTFTLQKIAFPVLMFSRQYAIGWARLFLASNRHLKLIQATLIPDGPPANLSRVGCDHCDPYRWVAKPVGCLLCRNL